MLGAIFNMQYTSNIYHHYEEITRRIEICYIEMKSNPFSFLNFTMGILGTCPNGFDVGLMTFLFQ